MDITTAGADLAKNLITVGAQDASGRTVERRDLRPDAFRSWLRRLPAGCIVGMEACSSAHYWAREMAALGLTPRIMAAEFVQPFRKSRAGKNDRNDAEAIAIAVREANMRFVAVKTLEQQARLARHRMREGWKEERTALGNRIRGILAEFGVVIPKSRAALGRELAQALHDERLPQAVRELVRAAREHLQLVHQRIAECDRAIGLSCRSDPATKRVQELCGVGQTGADAAVATIGDARAFKNGRQFAAWLGLTPRQFSSGGTTRLGAITRRGDAYLRTLLVQGARSALTSALRRPPERATRLQQWIVQLHARVGYQKALVAIANKNARVIWALLARDETYNPEAWRSCCPAPQ
jgi:transposase